jgi:DNA polymerase-3 subunit beta
VELTVPAALLGRELGLMQGVVEKRSAHPILSNVLIEARNGAMTLTATDLETTFIAEVSPTQIIAEGSVTAPIRRLFDLVKDLPPAAEIRLKVLENHHVQLDCKNPRLKIRLNGLPASDFPVRPEPSGGPTLTLPFAVLQRMVEKVRFAVSLEEMRLQLQGALLRIRGGGLEMAATDGHRLALVEVEQADADPSFEPVLISKKVLDELSRLTAEDGAKVTITRAANHIGFFLRSRRIFAKLEDRRFPDYEKVISKENHLRAGVDREALLGAVRRISLLAGDRTKGITMKFEPGAITVASESQEVGDGTQEVDAAYEGPVINLRLNAKYVEQFLEAAETKNVFLFLKDEQSQCQGRPGDSIPDLKDYLYVVMPLRT